MTCPFHGGHILVKRDKMRGCLVEVLLPPSSQLLESEPYRVPVLAECSRASRCCESPVLPAFTIVQALCSPIWQPIAGIRCTNGLQTQRVDVQGIVPLLAAIHRCVACCRCCQCPRSCRNRAR